MQDGPGTELEIFTLNWTQRGSVSTYMDYCRMMYVFGFYMPRLIRGNFCITEPGAPARVVLGWGIWRQHDGRRHLTAFAL